MYNPIHQERARHAHAKPQQAVASQSTVVSISFKSPDAVAEAFTSLAKQLKQPFVYFGKFLASYMLSLVACLLSLNTVAQSNGGTRIESLSSIYVSSTQGTSYSRPPAINSGSFTGTQADINYTFGANSGTTNNLLRVNSFVVGTGGSARTFEFLPVGTQEVVFRRVNNAVCSVARNLVWMEGTFDAATTPRVCAINRPYDDDMNNLFNGTAGFNSGTDNLFSNAADGNGNNNNIERLDVLFPEGLRVNTPANAGFALFERGNTSGHDGFTIALITALDAQGRPSAYATTFHRKAANSWGNTDLVTSRTYQVVRKDPSDDNLRISAPNINQPIGGIFFSFSDFGIAANTVVYGYSLAAPDYPSTSSAGMVDYTNATNFPTNTNSTNGGLDIIGVTGVVKVENTNAVTKVTDYNQVSEWNQVGVPEAVTSGPTIDPVFEQKIDSNIPEGENLAVNRPTLLNCATNDISVVTNTNISITFLKESTSKTNSLAYYTYSLSNPPTSAPAKTSLTLVFPNTSGTGSDGGLAKGATVNLGSFTAGTGIGWALVQNGYNVNQNAVGEGDAVFFSNPAFNAGSGNTRKQMVQFFDTASGRTVMAWEDGNRTNGQSDNDFNDVVFFFTPTSPSHCTTCNAGLALYESQSSNSQQGGLESNSLGDALSQYRFSLIRNNGVYVPDENLLSAERFDNFMAANTNNAITSGNWLSSYLPAAVSGMERSFSNPLHLLGLTNAVRVAGANYRKQGMNKAATLLILTRSRPYNHTKSLCDRVGGANIKNIGSIRVENFTFNRTLFERKDGYFEYATCFNISVNPGSNKAIIRADWRAIQAGGGDSVFNYQVWSSEGSSTNGLIQNIINLFRNRGYIVVQQNTGIVVPTAYVNRFERKDNTLRFFVTNNDSVTNTYAIQNRMRGEENASSFNIVRVNGNLQVPSGSEHEITQHVNDFMDGDAQLVHNGVIIDNVYHSDTRWTLDYNRNDIRLNTFDIKNNINRSYSNAEFSLLRGFKLNFTALRKTKVNVYKLASADGSPLNLQQYKAIRFNARGNAKVEVKITKAGITNWMFQYTRTFQANADVQNMTINFAEFTAPETTNAFAANDITSIVFTVISDDFDKRNIDLEISDVALVQTRNIVMPTVVVTAPVQVSPNPFNGRFIAEFSAPEDENMVAIIRDVNGNIVHQQNFKAMQGVNRVPVQVTRMLVGNMFKFQIQSAKQTYQAVTLLTGSK